MADADNDQVRINRLRERLPQALGGVPSVHAAPREKHRVSIRMEHLEALLDLLEPYLAAEPASGGVEEAEPPAPRVVPTELTVYPTGADPQDVEVRHFTLTVVARGAGRYAVIDRAGQALATDGTWSYESIPSERRAEWLDAHRFTRDEAVAHAIELVDQQTTMGRTWAQW